MLNDVFDGISQKLNETFGNDYKIYSEQVNQNFDEKSFFIDLLKPVNRQYIGNRFLRNYPFDIRFFPEENNNKTQEMCDIADQLILCLEYITVNGDLIRGKNISYEIIDNVLHFMIEYNIIVIHKDNSDQNDMENLEIISKVKFL